MTLCTIICGLYLQFGVAHMAHVETPPAGYDAWLYDVAQPRDPYGIAEIGWTSPNWHGLEAEFAARHFSSMATGQDHGANTIEARVRWHPFGR